KDDILANAWDKSPILWAVGLATALLTAYYMTRQVILVFYGEARWHTAEGHAKPHEAPPTMTLPLVVLAAFAAVAGAINLPFAKTAVLEHFLHPVLEMTQHELVASGAHKVLFAAIATAAA